MRQRLPNSPLVEVAFEVRFPGSFEVPARLDAFQRELGDSFPKLMVPNVKDGEAPALKPFSFVSVDDTERINVALNLFAYVTTQYATFSEFRDRSLQLWRRFRSLLHEPRSLTRFGLRYVNSLPWVEDVRSARLHPWLNLGLVPSDDRPVTQLQIDLVTRVDDDGAALRTSLSRVHEVSKVGASGARDVAAEVLLLDFDYSIKSIPLERVEGALESGHAVIDTTFFGMLTDEGLRSLGGTE